MHLHLVLGCWDVADGADLVLGWVDAISVHGEPQELDTWYPQKELLLLHLEAHSLELLQDSTKACGEVSSVGVGNRDVIKEGGTPGMPLNKVSVKFWKIPGPKLTPNCSLFTLKVCVYAIASSTGNC